MFQRILIGVDFSEGGNRALEVARAHFPGARRRLVHVALTVPAVSSALDFLEGSAAQADRVELGRVHLEDLRLADETTCFARGNVAEELLGEALAWGADLIVVGTHGRRGVSHALFGSVAEQVVRDASVPVLTVGRLTAPARESEPVFPPAEWRPGAG